MAIDLKYHHRTVSRAINALTKAGELALAIVEAHVKLVAKSVESISEIVSNLGLGNQSTPVAPAPPIPISIVEIGSAPISVVPTAPQPQQSQATGTTPRSNSGTSSIGNIIANMGFPNRLQLPKLQSLTLTAQLKPHSGTLKLNFS